MSYRYRGLAWAVSMGLSFAAAAQEAPHVSAARPPILTCDMTLAPESALQVQDEASAQGATVEGVTLIDLPNGMKTVQFSVRNARASDILRVRYTVQWFDVCGRRVINGAQVIDGLALDPRRQDVIQSTAMELQAARAFVRIYVEN